MTTRLPSSFLRRLLVAVLAIPVLLLALETGYFTWMLASPCCEIPGIPWYDSGSPAAAHGPYRRSPAEEHIQRPAPGGCLVEAKAIFDPEEG